MNGSLTSYVLSERFTKKDLVWSEHPPPPPIKKWIRIYQKAHKKLAKKVSDTMPNGPKTTLNKIIIQNVPKNLQKKEKQPGQLKNLTFDRHPPT